jgi:hypothetical protein
MGSLGQAWQWQHVDIAWLPQWRQGARLHDHAASASLWVKREPLFLALAKQAVTQIPLWLGRGTCWFEGQ